MSDIIVTGHQPGLLPYFGLFEKARRADIFIWCDRFQAVRHQWLNRNWIPGKRPDEKVWLTVPLDHRDWSGAIGDCRIGRDSHWQRKLSKTLELHYGYAAERYVEIIRRPWGRVAGLNIALAAALCDDLNVHPEFVRQCDLEAGAGNPLRIASGVADDLVPVSERLAAMTAEVGGTVWVSGESGVGYLDESPFLERGIRVEYVAHPAGPSAIETLAHRRLRTLGVAA